MQIYICHGTLNQDMPLSAVSTLIFKLKQYKNANFANFVYYGKTRLFGSHSVGLFGCSYQGSGSQDEPAG